MKIRIFNISAIAPSAEELESLNDELSGLSPERTYSQIVETPEGPAWSIICFLEESGSRKKPEPLPPLSDQDEEIYEALLDWRRHEARKESLPEHFILHNRTLRELALERPADQSELLEIRGIGEWKAETYGRGILKVIEAISRTQEG